MTIPAATLTDPSCILLLTRPRASSERFWASLAPDLKVRLTVLINPLIDIVPLPAPQLDEFAGSILTSAHAVPALAASDIASLPCFAVGEATALAARQAGIMAEAMGGTAEALANTLAIRGPDTPLVHLRGTHTRGSLSTRLTAAGVQTAEAVVYDQPLRSFGAEARTRLSAGHRVIAPLFSPRTAVQLQTELSRNLIDMAPIWPIFLSDAVAEAFGGDPGEFSIICADQTAESMALGVERAVNAIAPLERHPGPK